MAMPEQLLAAEKTLEAMAREIRMAECIALTQPVGEKQNCKSASHMRHVCMNPAPWLASAQQIHYLWQMATAGMPAQGDVPPICSMIHTNAQFMCSFSGACHMMHRVHRRWFFLEGRH